MGIEIGAAIYTGMAAAGYGMVVSSIVSVVGVAMIGATVGAITAGLVGGDIKKGMLYGAIGGAVTGGMGAWSAVGDIGGSLSGAAEVATNSESVVDKTGNAFVGVSKVPGSAGWSAADMSKNLAVDTPSMLSKAGELVTKGGGTVASSLIDTGGKMISGAATGEATEKAAALAAEQKATSDALAAKLQTESTDMQGAIASLNNETTRRGQDITAQTAANALQAQVDDAATERELAVQKRERQAGASSSQSVAAASGQLQGPSIREQVYAADGTYA